MGEEKNILFIKWDRFSRNVEYAYEMIGKLRKYKTTAMAIDQPIDFSVPESTVMLAVHLAVPEAENTRRAQNTSNGIRRAKLMGRYPNKAPIGFINITLIDGKKAIVPKQPEAEIIKWAFSQAVQNHHKISEISKIANEKGLICSRSYFFRILRNPIYCGIISIKLNSNERQMIKGLHEPLISESLFDQVQSVINTKRKTTAKRDDLKEMFFLRGFLTCPVCGRKLTGSFSKGKQNRYPYYHCHNRCKIRIGAVLLNDSYQNKLQELILADNTMELFKNILEGRNIKTQKASYLYAQHLVERKIKEEKLTLSKGRKLFVAGILKIDDYNELKKESQINTKNLKKEERDITVNLRVIDKINQMESKILREIFQKFAEFDTSDNKNSGNSKKLRFIWQINDIESSLSKTLDHFASKESYLIAIGTHDCNVFFENIDIIHRERAATFLTKYCINNYKNPDRMNLLINIVRHSFNELFEQMILLFLTLTQDVKLFEQIYWIGNGGTVVRGDVIFGDINAAEWRNILSIVNRSSIGISLLPIKRHINDKIDHHLEYAEWERKRSFFGAH